MQRPNRNALIGFSAGVPLLGALVASWWLMVHPSDAQTPAQNPAQQASPGPRIGSGPDYERCVAKLRADPVGARTFAEEWLRRLDAAGNAGAADGAAARELDGARHCQALSMLALGQPDRAAARLEALAGASHGPTAARAVTFAQASQAWLMAGDANRAYGAATMALALSPADPTLLVDRAVAAGSLGRYAEAVEDLDRALALDPGRTEALVFRAAARRHLERLDLAAEDVERALAAEPNNVEALLERGILRQLRGNAQGAREDWERAVRLAPDSPTADLARQNLALNEAGPPRR